MKLVLCGSISFMIIDRFVDIHSTNAKNAKRRIKRSQFIRLVGLDLVPESVSVKLPSEFRSILPLFWCSLKLSLWPLLWPFRLWFR